MFEAALVVGLVCLIYFLTMSVLYVFAGLMPRFSLRTLFVLMTLIILLIGAFQIFYSIAKR